MGTSLPVKDFKVRVEHHNVDGLRATVRLVPQNYCLATVTGIDAATREFDAEFADRIGAAINMARGIETSDLKMLERSGMTINQLMVSNDAAGRALAALVEFVKAMRNARAAMTVNTPEREAEVDQMMGVALDMASKAARMLGHSSEDDVIEHMLAVQRDRSR